MNSPQPTPVKTETVTSASAPTVGAGIGAAVGTAITAKLGLDATTGIMLTSAITAGVTALFHYLGNKFGIPSLG